MIQIKSIEQLKKITTGGYKCFRMYLNGGLYSAKSVIYLPKEKLFRIENYIDNSVQKLTEEQLINTRFTFIGSAIKKGAFFLET